MKTFQKLKIPMLLLLIFSNSFYQLQAQDLLATIKGKLIDKSTKEPLPFANVILSQSGKVITGAQTDFDGKYTIKSIEPGKYELEAKYVGYQSVKKEGVIAVAGKIVFVDFEISAGAQLNTVKIEAYKQPLISLDNPFGGTVTRENISRMPNKSSRHSKRRNKKKESSSSYGYYNTSRQDVLTNESYAGIVENDFKKVTSTPLSTLSIDVDAASYSNMRRFITNGQNPPANAVRVEEMINYFSYDYPQPKGEDPFSITTEMSDCPWNKKHKLIHVGLQGEKIETDRLPASNLVFLLDVSGSMSSSNKLPLLKKSFGLLVKNLTKEDRVAIVVYAGAAGLVLESTPGNEKEKIMNALNNLNAGGSTAGGQGIKLAYKIALQNLKKNGNNRVILATDGDFNVGASSDEAMTKLIEEKRQSGIFLTCLGFGMGNYKDAKMEVLADKGNGNYAYIDNILEAKKVLVTEMGATMHTIAKDVKIQVEFNPNKIASYKLIGYENRLLKAEDFNDDTKDAGELGAGHTVTALYEVVLKGSEADVPAIDPLRYQKNKPVEVVKTNSDEVLTVKFRYKEPKGKKSKLIVKHLTGKPQPLKEASDNFKFSAAVAEFGLLLRNSKYKAHSSYDQVIQLAKKSKGLDENGYRAEFIRLVEMSEMQASALLSE